MYCSAEVLLRDSNLFSSISKIIFLNPKSQKVIYSLIHDCLNRCQATFVILPDVVFNMHGSHGDFETHPKPGIKFGSLVVVEFFIQKIPNPILKIQILEVSLHVHSELQKNSFSYKNGNTPHIFSHTQKNPI